MKKLFAFLLFLALLAPICGQASTFITPKQKFWTTTNTPLAGGTLTFYKPGTTTLKNVYSDKACTIAVANPYTLDAYGMAPPLYMKGQYKVTLKNSAGVVQPGWPVDYVEGLGAQVQINASDYGGLNGAIAVMGSTPCEVVIDFADTLTGATTVPATMGLRFAKGGSIDRAAYNIAINGPFPEDIAYRIFYGTGVTTFGEHVSRVNPNIWGAIPGDTTDDGPYLKEAIDTGKKVMLRGKYYSSIELLFVTAGQVMEGDGPGWGTLPSNYVVHTGIVFTTPTVSQRAVKTRRLARATSGDPQDSPMSAAINIEAENVQLKNFAIYLNCDYTDTTPANLGDDWDIGLFNGCRGGLRTENLHIIGHWRIACNFTDVTRHSTLPEFSSLAGVQYPVGTGTNGCDNIKHINPLWMGGRWGDLRLGALGTSGDPYYDEILGGTVTDARGSSGCSDYVVIGGTINGPQHVSGYRWTDPGAVNPLTTVAYAAETLSSGAVYIDARAGIVAARVTKQTYEACRFVSDEPFIVRIDHVGNIRFNNSHWEWGVATVTPAAGGAAVDPSDTTNYGYGTIAVTANTGSVSLYHPSTNVPSESWFWDIVGTTGDVVRMLISPEDGANRMQGGRSGYPASMTIDGDYRGRSYVSYKLDLDDNEAAVIPVGTRYSGIGLVSSNVKAKPHFAFSFRAHSTATLNFCQALIAHADVVFSDNEVLSDGEPATGGGTDAKLNVSTSTTDATGTNIYFKNCLGAGLVLYVTFFGEVSVPPPY